MSVTKSDVQKWYEAWAIINPKYNNKTSEDASSKIPEAKDAPSSDTADKTTEN